MFQVSTSTVAYIYEPFGLARFATDGYYALQVNGRCAALLLNLSAMENGRKGRYIHLSIRFP